jgi:hypothetical protein
MRLSSIAERLLDASMNVLLALQDQEYWRQKRERPAQEVNLQWEQNARAREAGRRATAAYAMLRKSREARDKASSEASAPQPATRSMQ